jgi:predicted acetyltransferase
VLGGSDGRGDTGVVARLVPPCPEVHTSYLVALAEFQREGRYCDLRLVELANPRRFAAHLDALRAEALPDASRGPGLVPATHLWLVEGEEFVGRLSVRHRLTEELRRLGGHIGYEVRPSARRCGHATRMLALALPVARRLGIDPALVTCDARNTASRRVIERNGGVLGEEEYGVLRFWVPTRARG